MATIRKKTYPKCLQELGDIPNHQGKIRVRIIQHEHALIGKSEPLFDIRLWVDGEGEDRYSGLTKIGITLTQEQLSRLLDIGTNAIECGLLDTPGKE